MTREEFNYQLMVVADIQRREGWSEKSIALYAQEMIDCTPDECLPCTLMIGAGLAQDNSRFGVYCKTAFKEKTMHPICTFTPYLSDGFGRHLLTGDSTLLLWSHPTGYFISKLGFLSDFDSVNIVGIKEE